MKIFFPLQAFFPSQIGGPCNTLFWHTCALVKHEIEVDIVSTTIGIERDSVVENKFIKSKCGNVYYGRGGAKNFKTILMALKSIKACDILHLNSLFSVLSIASFFYTKVFYSKKPIVWSVRGELNGNALIYNRQLKELLLWIYSFFSNSILFHSTSREESADIERIFPRSRIVCIPNFIQPSERLNEVVSPYILFMGRIHPIKGIHKLVKALSLSSKFMNSEFKLVIAGTFEERHRSYYESLIGEVRSLNLLDKVVFRGHVKGDTKDRLYAGAYFTVLPSETENFGNVVVESLNQGTPVVASLGTPWSILSDFGCGLHVSNEYEELAKAVDCMLSIATEQYLSMREKAVELVDAHYNVEIQINQWVKQYQNIYNAKE